MKWAIAFVMFAAMIFLAGCLHEEEKEKDGDCSISMQNTRNARGEPEEWTSYDASGYHSRTWWYWTQGFSRSFAWGSDIEGCDWSDYSFDPIR